MKRHFKHIDVLKGICILIVIIEHAKWDRNVWLKGFFPFWDRIAIPCFMVISGYVYTKSIERNTVKGYYSFKNISRKLKRYLIPFLFIFVLENLIYFIISIPSVMSFLNTHFNYNAVDETYRFTLYNLGKALITGSYGPGNYYTPVLIQLIFLVPLLYLLIKRFRYGGLVTSFFLCLFFEVMQYSIGLPKTVWRNLIFRHIMTIGFGIYLSLGYYKKNKALNLISLLTGFAYIVAHSYYRWTPAFFNNGWADVNLIACLFFCPIIAHLIGKKDLQFPPLEYIGKASYHVYLAQMVYYNFVKRDIMIHYFKIPYLWCLFSLVVIVTAGLCFYRLEKAIRKWYQDPSIKTS